MKKRNFKELLDDDRLLWIFSFVLAFALWWMVIGTVYTTSDTTVRRVPVDFSVLNSNSSELEPVLDAPMTVDVEVHGERSVVGALRPEDLLVEPDLSGVTEAGEYTLRLNASSRQGTAFDVVALHPKEVTVRFDRMVTKELAVSVDFEGIDYPEGYVLGEEYINVRHVTVTGPETEMANVSRCVARLSVDRELSRTEVLSAPLLLLDREGNVVESPYIQMSAETAAVTVPVLKMRTLPLTVSFLNVPSDFPLDELDYTLSVDELTVAGPAESVDKLNELNLGYIDFCDLDLDAYHFNVSLPAGFVNLDGEETVTVTLAQEGMDTAVLNVPDLRVVNVPANFTVELLTKNIPNVRLYGRSEVLSQLTAQDLVAEIDLSQRELKEGQSRVIANISAPGKGLVWANGTYQVQIIVKPK